MQTDMSPIDDSYDPLPPPPPQQRETPTYYEPEPLQHESPFSFYHQVPQPYFQQQAPLAPAPVTPPPGEKGLFANIDKITWSIIGLAILVAFFMGKTMQPVILKT